MSYTIKLSLDPQQYKKMLKSKTVQLTHNNLVHVGSGANIPIEINVSKDLNTKINRAIRLNKGIRLTDKHHIGGKLSLTNKILKPLTNGVSKIFGNKKVSEKGIELGQTTNDKILPFVATVGKPVFLGTAGIVGSTLGGPVGGIASTAVANELYSKYAQNVADRQKDPTLKKGAEFAGKFSASQLAKASKSGGAIINSSNALFMHTQGDLLAGVQYNKNVNIPGLHKLPNKVNINSFSAMKKTGLGFLPLGESKGKGFKTI